MSKTKTMKPAADVTINRLWVGYRVDNEHGYACLDTAAETAKLAMSLLRNAGAKPTERLYCDVLSAMNAKARIIDVTTADDAFEINVIDRGGNTDAWTAPRTGTAYAPKGA